MLWDRLAVRHAVIQRFGMSLFMMLQELIDNQPTGAAKKGTHYHCVGLVRHARYCGSDAGSSTDGRGRAVQRVLWLAIRANRVHIRT